MLQSEPGKALRAWTEIDHDVTDQAPFVAIANTVRWWLTSERVGNYQNGDISARAAAEPDVGQLTLRAASPRPWAR